MRSCSELLQGTGVTTSSGGAAQMKVFCFASIVARIEALLMEQIPEFGAVRGSSHIRLPHIYDSLHIQHCIKRALFEVSLLYRASHAKGIILS